MNIAEGSPLWTYLSEQQRMLANDGDFLIRDSAIHHDDPTDYSYLVFPYAKMYEGFLKQLFRDLSIISERDYNSDHFRIGRALSPNLARRLGKRSAYKELADRYNNELTERMWQTWKQGRNLVFHYFPHNVRALERNQAIRIVQEILDTMDQAVRVTQARSTPTAQSIARTYIGKGRYRSPQKAGVALAYGAATR